MAEIQIERRRLAKRLQSIGLNHGLVLGPKSHTLTPLQLQKAAGGSEFSHGVLACLAEIAQLFEQPGSCGRGVAQALDDAKPDVVLRKDPNQPPVPLHLRLEYCRRWLLGRRLTTNEYRAMDADPWYSMPDKDVRMAVSVVATLRELVEEFEKHGVEFGLAQQLLLDQPVEQQAQQPLGSADAEVAG